MKNFITYRDAAGKGEKLSHLSNRSRDFSFLTGLFKILPVSAAGTGIKLLPAAIIILFSFFSPVNTNGQNKEKIDSLEILLESTSGSERVDMLLEISRLYWDYSFERSLDYANEAYKISESIGYLSGMADALNRSGNVHYFLNNYDWALEYYESAYEIIHDKDDYRREGSILNNIGLLYFHQQMFGDALRHLEKALDAKRMTGDDLLVSSTLANLGILKTEIRDYEGAHEYYYELLDILEERAQYPEMGKTYSAIANVYYLKKEFSKSLEKYYIAREILTGTEESFPLASLYNRLGKVYLETGNLGKASEYFSMGGEVAEKLGLDNLRSENYRYLSEYFEATGNAKAAHDYFVMHLNMKDSLFKAESEENLLNLKNIFETESKEREIELLQKQYEVQKMNLRQQQSRNFFIIISIILAAVILFIFSRRFGIRSRANRILKEKNSELENMNEKLILSGISLRELNATKDRFFSIVAHDLKNPFNQLLGASENIAKNINNLKADEVKEQVDFINRSSRNLFRLLENLLQWSAAQTKTLHCTPERFDLNGLIKIEIQSAEKSADEKNITLVFQPGSDNFTVYADKNLVACILRNLIDNAIKYSREGGAVTVSSSLKEDFAKVCIADNGEGIEQERLEKIFQIDGNHIYSGSGARKGTGLGLILCREFAEINGGKIIAESKKGEGSRFCFTVPACI